MFNMYENVLKLLNAVHYQTMKRRMKHSIAYTSPQQYHLVSPRLLFCPRDISHKTVSLYYSVLTLQIKLEKPTRPKEVKNYASSRPPNLSLASCDL